MVKRSWLLIAALALTAGVATGQSDTNDGPRWRSPREAAAGSVRVADATSGTTTTNPAPAAPSRSNGTPPVGSRSGGGGVLPNSHGQVWREYDISRYTLRVATDDRPQQAIIDWILRETGYEAWHSETVAMLSGSRNTLRVYHTPEMQQVVADIVSRFVSSAAETHTYALQLCTVGHPDWRSKAQKLVRPVPVQSPGAEAWLLAKEDAATLLTELSKRTDFRSLSSPNLMVNNGQNAAVTIGRTRPYVRSVLAPGNSIPGAQPGTGQFEEGVKLQLNPLMSLDGRTVDAMVKCNIDQIEKLVPVRMEYPGSSSQARRWYSIDVPQIASCQFHERFHWPREKVLMVSLGMVPRPGVHNVSPIKLPTNSSKAARADLLIFIQHKANSAVVPTAAGGVVREAEVFRGRY